MNRNLRTLLHTVVGKNLKTQEDCLPFIEFAYTRTIHSSIGFSPFEIVYDFNPLTVLDLMSLPLSDLVSLDSESKAEKVKAIHMKAHELIEKKSKLAAQRVNKGQKQVVFEPGDWVWVHLKKEQFPTQWKSKLDASGDGPIQVLERINDNAYKIELPCEYNVSATINISNLSPFDMGTDSRMNLFEQGGNDTGIGGQNGHSNTRGQDGDFSMPVDLSQGRELREGFRNLAKSFMEETH